jgi:hypothetical protein
LWFRLTAKACHLLDRRRVKEDPGSACVDCGLAFDAAARAIIQNLARRCVPLSGERDLRATPKVVRESRMSDTRRILIWLMLAILAALVSYVGFRGYLMPELLFNFANSLHC